MAKRRKQVKELFLARQIDLACEDVPPEIDCRFSLKLYSGQSTPTDS